MRRPRSLGLENPSPPTNEGVSMQRWKGYLFKGRGNTPHSILWSWLKPRWKSLWNKVLNILPHPAHQSLINISLFFKGVFRIPHLHKCAMVVPKILKVVSIFMKGRSNKHLNIRTVVMKDKHPINGGVITSISRSVTIR